MKQTQRGSLTKSSSAWHVRYRDIDVGEDGKPKRVLRSHRLCDGKLKRSEALTLMADYMSQRVGPIEADVPSWRLVDFIQSEYLPRCKERCSASTYLNYANIFKTHGVVLDPNQLIRDFTTYTGQMMMKKISARSNLSRESLKHIRSFFTGVFTHALRLGAINHGNPMRYVEVPKGGHETADTYAYSPEEIEAMLAVLPEPANTAVLLAASTGLRRSEIQGLIWDDWQGDTLTIKRAVWRTITKETKGKSSRAPIPVTRELQERLASLIPQETHLRSQPILAGPSGKPLNLANLVRRVIVPALKRCFVCGLTHDDHARVVGHSFVLNTTIPRWHGWHSARRGLATYLHHKGIMDTVIQRILRHSDVSVTRRSYIKMVEADTRKAMEQMDGLFNSKGVA